MTEQPPSSNQSEPKLKALAAQGLIGAIALAGTTAIPLIVQQVLQRPQTPAATPVALPSATPTAEATPVALPSATPTAEATPVANPVEEVQLEDSSSAIELVQEDSKGKGKPKREKDDED